MENSQPRRILVAIKRVVDYNVRIRVKPDGSGVALDGVKLSINPFDAIAIEEALRIKERGRADEVVITTIGPADCQATLRNALAMGAQRAVHVVADTPLEPLDNARVLLKLVEREQPFLVILGKQAIDDDNNQTGQMLAALWNRPQATFASKLELTETSAKVTREVDAGLETLDVDLPAVITTDLRLNEPRFVKLPEIMKAKTKPLASLSLMDLALGEIGGAGKARVKVQKTEPPPGRQRGIMVKDTASCLPSFRSGASYEQGTHHCRACGRQVERLHGEVREGGFRARRRVKSWWPCSRRPVRPWRHRPRRSPASRGSSTWPTPCTNTRSPPPSRRRSPSWQHRSHTSSGPRPRSAKT